MHNINEYLQEIFYNMNNQAFYLRTRPVGLPQPGDFEMLTEDVLAPVDGQVLLKTLYISVDPYLRGKMSGTKVPRFEIGEPISSKLIAEVVESKNRNFKSGDLVTTWTGKYTRSPTARN